MSFLEEAGKDDTDFRFDKINHFVATRKMIPAPRQPRGRPRSQKGIISIFILTKIIFLSNIFVYDYSRL